MSKIFIKDPQGRIVAAPQNVIVTKVVNGKTVNDSVNEAALKPGWAVATKADIAAQYVKNVDADNVRDAAQKGA